MPSVIETMVPTLRASVGDLKFSIRCLMRSEISLALMAICPLTALRPTPLADRARARPRSCRWRRCAPARVERSASRRELVRHALELAAERAVDHEVAGAQHSAAEELRIDLAMHPHAPLQPPLQRFGESAAVRLVDRRCRGDDHVRDALGLVLELVEQGRDLGKQRESAILREREDEVPSWLPELIAHHIGDELRELARRDLRIAEQLSDARIRSEE